MPNKTDEKRVLVIAYHFPPCAISSGIQRTLSFTKYLSRHGWHPVVLTVRNSAYERTNPSQLKNIPADVIVSRTFALDAARHLSFGGRHWSKLALPDRWRTWWLSAVPTGLKLIREHSIDAIWSTYPIATAHNIGATLSRISGVPWIADFRDPMVEYVARTNETYPLDPALRAARLRIEALAVAHAKKLVFCTKSASQIVAERYPKIEASRLAVISNGYDEQAFIEAEKLVPLEPKAERVVLLHSGTIYLSEDRDPTALFQAIKTLADKAIINAQNFELRLRDPSNNAAIQAMVSKAGISEFVTILPSRPYAEALAEMMCVDGLLVLQGHTSNPAVPAKLYEYLRAGRSILGLVDAAGETANTLRTMNIDTLADIIDTKDIAGLLEKWLNAVRSGNIPTSNREKVSAYSRESLTVQLAKLLDEQTT